MTLEIENHAGVGLISGESRLVRTFSIIYTHTLMSGYQNGDARKDDVRLRLRLRLWVKELGFVDPCSITKFRGESFSGFSPGKGG